MDTFNQKLISMQSTSIENKGCDPVNTITSSTRLMQNESDSVVDQHDQSQVIESTDTPIIKAHSISDKNIIENNFRRHFNEDNDNRNSIRLSSKLKLVIRPSPPKLKLMLSKTNKQNTLIINEENEPSPLTTSNSPNQRESQSRMLNFNPVESTSSPMIGFSSQTISIVSDKEVTLTGSSNNGSTIASLESSIQSPVKLCLKSLLSSSENNTHVASGLKPRNTILPHINTSSSPSFTNTMADCSESESNEQNKEHSSYQDQPDLIKATNLTKDERIPVFEHILLLPPSHHRATKGPDLPSNYYFTPEEEEKQKLSRRLKRKRMYKTQALNKHVEDPPETFEVSRNGRIRKKPKLYSDYIIGDSTGRIQENISIDGSESDDESFSPEVDTWLQDNSFHDLPSLKTSSKGSRIKYGFDKKGNDYWNKQVQSLLRFKSIYGHTRVSQRRAEDIELARWVKKVREKYKRVQNGIIVPTLTQERIDQLNSIGFTWVVRSSKFNSTFEQHFADLKAFKNENGHTRVPHVYDKNPKLGRWCHHIKLSYKKIQQGQKPMIHMKQEHIDKLNAIDFQWRIRNLVATNNDEDSHYDFDKFIRKLIEFKDVHGHTNVTRGDENDDLAYWVSSIRSSYRLLREGKRPIIRLNKVQIETVSNLNFDWTDNFYKHVKIDRNVSKIVSWNDRYDQLCRYKTIYGNCHVPSIYDDDKTFGNWVSFQRRQLGAKLFGRSSLLSDEQQKKLEDVGLKYSVYEYNNGKGTPNKRKSTNQDKSKLISSKKMRVSHIVTVGSNGDMTQNRTTMSMWCKNLDLGFVFENSPNSSKDKEILITTSQHTAQRSEISSWLKDLNIGFCFEATQNDQNTNIVKKRLRLPFDSHLEALWDYKRQYGHLNVSSKENKSLNNWISNVRVSFKRSQSGKTPLIKLTEDRMKKLASIGFDFKCDSQVNKDASNNVYKRNERQRSIAPTMDKWIKCLGLGFENANVGSKSMSDWLQQLDIGFLFVENSITRSDVSKVRGKPRPFHFYTDKLKAYKAQHGHIDVSKYDDKSLHAWISNVKTSYHRIENGKSPLIKLTEERLMILEGLGFSFLRKRRSAQTYPSTYQATDSMASSVKISEIKQTNLKKKTFEQHIEELHSFITLHGHMKIADIAQTNKSLGHWCRNVKSSYNRLQRGDPQIGLRLTNEKIEKLNAIGFDFSSNIENASPAKKTVVEWKGDKYEYVKSVHQSTK